MKNFFKILNTLLIGLLLIPTLSFAQEFTIKKSPEEEKREKELKEEQAYLNFQTHFFEAIHQKAGEDYNKAIESLENCMQIYPNDIGMNFEFAKNYLLLKDYENAIFFDKKVLAAKPDNVYVLEHLKKVYRSQQDINSAIEIQKQIIAIKPERKSDLIMLYISNRQLDKAKKLLLKLENKNQLVNNAAYFKQLLFPKLNIQKKKVKAPTTIHATNAKPIASNNSINELREQFQKNKSYAILKQLLSEEDALNQLELLVKDSKSGLELFPAQPYLYFMQGKAQNQLHKYNKALEALKAGLDFIIDNNSLEADFYKQIEKAYLGLGNIEEATKYSNKALLLKKTIK